MKDLNCYARFWDEPDIEKLVRFYQVTSSFLKLVTSRPCRLFPICFVAVIGLVPRESRLSNLLRLVTAIFSTRILTPGGPNSFQRSSLRGLVSLARRFFLYLCFHCVRPVRWFVVETIPCGPDRPHAPYCSTPRMMAGCNHFSFPLHKLLLWQPASFFYPCAFIACGRIPVCVLFQIPYIQGGRTYPF